jgi:long-chain acyl-CoA synthetase
MATPPPPGTPYAGPIPGTELENRSPIYRHWRFLDQPLLETFDPAQQTLHDLYEEAVRKWAGKQCLGWRPWNPTTGTWENKYVWLTYAQVAERRKNLGAGIVELHEKAGISSGKYGVGLWSQNRPEWQISGK